MSPVLDFVKTLHPQRTWEEMTYEPWMTLMTVRAIVGYLGRNSI